MRYRPIRPALSRGIVLFLCLALAGCLRAVADPPPSQQMRARLGTIAVVAAPVTPPARIERPPAGAGEGALAGAAEGALNVLLAGYYAGAYTHHPEGLAIATAAGILLAPVGALFGGIAGAFQAPSTGEVEAAAAVIEAAFAADRPNEEICDRVVRIAKINTRYELSPCLDHGPEAGYGELAGYGFDSVLEIEMLSLGLAGPYAVDPPLSVVVIVEARLISLPNGDELYRRSWAYTGRPRRFFGWVAGDARLFRDELDQAYGQLARQIVFGLLLADLAAPAPTLLTFEAR